MTDMLIALVPVYGVWLLAVGTFLSCLAVPVPTSLMMLAAGGFVASGELVAWQVCAGALGGAVLGDQAGFGIGRRGGGAILDRLSRAPKRKKLVTRATVLLQNRGAVAVFLSRWLISPLGPYVNFAGGAANLSHRRFSLASVLGETLWVAIYVGLGARFANDIAATADMLGSATGFIAALAVVIVLGVWLRAALRQRSQGR